MQLPSIVDAVFSLLPIGVMLAAMVVLRRRHRDRATTLILQLAAAAWFVIALLNRSLANGNARADSVPLLHRLEQAAFIVFSVTLLLFFRHRTLEARRKA